MIAVAPLGTPAVWLVSENEAVLGALSAFVSGLIGKELPIYFSQENAVLLSNPQQLHYDLSKQSNLTLANLAVAVDLTTYSTDCSWRLDGDSHPLRPTELVMRYPEIYWIFIVSDLPALPNRVCEAHFVRLDALPKLITCVKRYISGFRPLYDPTGFRNVVISGRVETKVALAIEDEVTYCLLNGYSLYRQGFNTYIACTRTELEACCQTGVTKEACAIIEDVELQFPDLTEDNKSYGALMPQFDGEPDETSANEAAIANVLKTRGRTFHFGQQTKRIVISSRRCTPATMKDGSICCWITKPYSGFYDRQFPSGLFPNLECEQGSATTTPATNNRGDTAQISSSAPTGGDNTNNDSERNLHRASRAHSAPGMHQQVAWHLINRCKQTRPDASTPEASIQIATLALTARQLLQNKTLHMSLDAIALQHRQEVEAECTFIGTSNRFDVGRRVHDVENTVSVLLEYTHWFNPFVRWNNKAPKRRRQRTNAMLEICGDLREVYQEHNQKVEEDKTLQFYRKWERLAEFSRFDGRAWRSMNWVSSFLLTFFVQPIVKLILTPARGYVNLLLRGPVWLLVISVVWTCLFAMAYRANVSPHLRERAEKFHMHFWHYWKMSATIFVSLQPAMEEAVGVPQLSGLLEARDDRNRPADKVVKPPTPLDEEIVAAMHRYWSLILAEISIGYLHLGALISLLLDRASRK